MEALKKYPKDFSKAFEPSLNFLYRCNIRILNNHESLLTKYWRFFFIIPSIALLYVTSAIQIFVMLSQEQIYLIAYLVPPFLVCTQAILKAIVLAPKTEEVTAIIEELGNLWRVNITESQRKERTALLKKLNFSNNVLYWVSLFGSWQYFISPMLETLVRRLILKQDCELLLPMSCSYPLSSTNNWFMYIAIYIFQTYSMFLCVFVYVGAELIMITLCALLGSEFTLIREDLQRLNPAAAQNEIATSDLISDGIDSVNTIKDFVKRHQKLIALSRKLDTIFNPMIFFDLFFVGITTCFFRYAGQFSRGPTYMVNNYVAVFASLQQVLYLCYYGELLTGASVGIGDAAYKSVWYHGDSQYRKIIWLIIKRSQSPCSLTSMRYAVINLNMVTKVISSTWSYFSLMNSVYGEE